MPSRRCSRRSTGRPDELWCLGDLVGYGPRPNRCCALMAERADVCLIGNHDLAALGRLDLEIFSPDAAVSDAWTADNLEPETRTFLEHLERGERERRALPREPARPGLGVHPLPRHRLRGPCRDPAAARPRRAQPRGAPLPPLDDDARHRRGRRGARPGGRPLAPQPRLGRPAAGRRPRAAWLLLDLGPGRRRSRREAYDIAATQAESGSAGYPRPWPPASSTESSSTLGVDGLARDLVSCPRARARAAPLRAPLKIRHLTVASA